MAQDPETSSFWDTDNTRRGSFSWSLMPPAALAAAIAAAAPQREPAGGQHSAPLLSCRVLIVGAGTSDDSVHIAKALNLPPSAITAADFSPVAVAHQAAYGVTAVHMDVLRAPRADWVGAWDIVVDAVFTDVFTSCWRGDGGPRRCPSASAAAALRALLSFVAPGGLLVVKSMVQCEEEYAAYVRSVAKMEYTPQRVYDVTEMHALATAGGANFSGGVSRFGRKRTLTVPNFGMAGHVGLWRITN